ncbi:MAG: hypothetical protein IT480_05245 [Gammaproteobacteria bacterium]|nr:hypothetical protein [Gammaproteobacteria bacterium]
MNMRTGGGFAAFAFVLGLSGFFMMPLIADVKPFDLLAITFLLLKARQGFALRRDDLPFLVFIAFAVASLAMSRYVVETSALQTARYFVYFLIARLALSDAEHRALRNGLLASMVANLAWMVIDVAQYYTVGGCMSLNERAFPWVEQVVTNRYPIEVGNCFMLRPTGFTWDPGGLFPIMLVTAYALGARRLLVLGSLGALFAVSRTALLTVFTIWLAKRSQRAAWILVALILVVVPAVTLMYAAPLAEELTDGTVRHLVYPALALTSLYDDPRYLLLGDGLRGGAAVFLARPEPFMFDFFEVDQLIRGTARQVVVESIWINLLTGAGLVGFVAYANWFFKGLARLPATLLGFIVAGTYYTFDSSAFCFVSAYLMMLPAAAGSQQTLARRTAPAGAEGAPT